MPLSLRQVGSVRSSPAAMPDARTYAIGEIAARTGLTVRALRHYERIGLLAPHARTAAGHRRYGASDVARLQQIVSLRAVGLPLAAIRDLLDAPGSDPAATLDRHAARLRAEIAHKRRLADRLGALARHYRASGTADVGDLLSTIRLTTMFETHFTPEQLQQLQDRAEAIGQAHIGDVQNQWTVLFERLEALRADGVDPAAPEAQTLAAEARGYIGEFTGGDASLRASLDEAFVANRDEMYAAWGITPELGAYYDRVMRAGAAG